MAARPWQWLTWCRQHWGAELQTIFCGVSELDQVTYSLLRLVDHELASELYLQIKEGEARFPIWRSRFPAVLKKTRVVCLDQSL